MLNIKLSIEPYGILELTMLMDITDSGFELHHLSMYFVESREGEKLTV